MNQSSYEKNGWSAQIATMSRPVWARASLTAAVVASEPFLANLTISAPAIRSSSASALSSSIAAGRVKLMPSSQLRAAASTTGWIGVAERDGPKAHAVLDEFVASVSQTWQPGPRPMSAGRDLGILVVALRVRVRATGDDGVRALAQIERLCRSQMSPRRLLSGFHRPTHRNHSKGTARTAVKDR